MYFTKEENLLHFTCFAIGNQKVLIESTVFSKNILSKDWYKEKIYKYLSENNINEFEEDNSGHSNTMFFLETDQMIQISSI